MAENSTETDRNEKLNEKSNIKFKSLESLAYLMKNPREGNSSKPIVFLGAGVSASAGIPLADKIMTDILEKYEEKPEIQNLTTDDRDYANVMGCLNAGERNQLLRTYIKEAKVNVAHIYLAQMLKENLIDYVVTVNFDNLMERACSLFNFIPPTYDMAILNETTTTTIPEGSVVFLHGQQHGLWLLNTESEMSKVKKRITKVFNKICHNRPWIIIGYSGCDPVFDVLADMGRFDDELFWIGFRDEKCSKRVADMLLGKNNGSYWIKNYDSDSFFLKLHSELGMETPEIFEKPFSYLKSVMDNIQDINLPKESETSENQKTKTTSRLFEDTKERSERSKEFIEDAIKKYETGEDLGRLDDEQITDKRLEKRFIELTTKQEYEKAEALLENSNDKESDLYHSLYTKLYTSWAYADYQKWMTDTKSDLIDQSLAKYKKVNETYIDDYIIFNNWGAALYQKGVREIDIEKFNHYLNESIQKYKRALVLHPDYALSYGNWALSLQELGLKNDDKELLRKSIEKSKEAISYDPNESVYYVDWGNALSYIAYLKNEPELYHESIKKYEVALTKNEQSEYAYSGLGFAHLHLYENNMKDVDLLNKSINYTKKALSINDNLPHAYDNLGVALKHSTASIENEHVKLAVLKEAENNLIKSVSLHDEAIYNLACLYALQNKKVEALDTLEKSLVKKQQTVDYILTDIDWDVFKNDPEFTKLIDKYR